MSGKKFSGGLLAEDAGGMGNDFALGAAHVSEQRALGEQRAHALEAINNRAHRRSQQNQLAAFNGFFRAKVAGINGAGGAGLLEYHIVVAADDASLKTRPAGGQSKRTADKAHADDGDLAEFRHDENLPIGSLSHWLIVAAPPHGR